MNTVGKHSVFPAFFRYAGGMELSAFPPAKLFLPTHAVFTNRIEYVKISNAISKKKKRRWLMHPFIKNLLIGFAAGMTLLLFAAFVIFVLLII